MKWIAPFFCLIFLLQCSRGERPPNVIHIVADDLGVMDVGFMGDGRYHTPHIDRLASEGMVFTNGYAPAANCAPSRACVMTGQNPMFHGVYTVGNSDRGKARTRKSSRPPTPSMWPTNTSCLPRFSRSRATSSPRWVSGTSVTIRRPRGSTSILPGTIVEAPGTYFSPYRVPHLEDGPEGEYLTDRLTTEAIKILEAHKDEKFFLYFPYYTVHMPIQGKPELIKKYAEREDVNPEYAAMVESLDENVGRLMEALDRLGLTENTIVVFTSDNGGIRDISPQDPYRAGKGSYYEGGVRVPFAVRWPGMVEPGTTSDVPVTGLDFYPTYLDILGQKTEKELDGTSLAPLLKGEGTIDTRPLFWHFPIYLQAYNPKTDDGRDPLFRTRPGSTMRYGKWKLHHYFEDMAYELYDLEEDPGERKDLAGAMPDKVARNWPPSSMPGGKSTMPRFLKNPTRNIGRKGSALMI
jgi:arylsulfatase A-like enzyme